jgi:hypothetical protein
MFLFNSYKQSNQVSNQAGQLATDIIFVSHGLKIFKNNLAGGSVE